MSINKNEIFAITISIFIGLIVYISRLGYVNFGREILLTIFLTSSVIFFPNYLSTLLTNKFNLTKQIKFPLRIFIILFFIFSLSYASNFINLLIIIFAIGLIALFFYIKELKNHFKKNLTFLFISIVFSFWCIFAFYNNLYSHPLSYEQLSVGAFFHRDTMWHASISGMIKTYNLPSIGVDGLLKYYYHIFSNYLSAHISSILNVSTFKFYTLLFPVFFIPLFFLFFIETVIEINKVIYRDDYKSGLKLSNLFFIVLLTLFSIIIPNNFINEKYHFFQSYSYLIALLILFILIKLLLISYVIINQKIYKKFDFFVLLLLFILLYFALVISKFSFLYFFTASYIFFYLRLNLYNKSFFNLLLVCMLIINFLTFYYFISPFMSFNIRYGYHEDFKSTIQNFYSNFIESSRKYYTYLYYSIIFIFFRILNLDIKFVNLFKSNHLIDLIKNKKLLDIEYLVFLSLALFIFPWQYTNGIQIYIAYLLILSFFPSYFFALYKYNYIKKIIFSFLVLLFLSSSSINFIKISYSFFAHNLTIRQSFANENNYKNKIDANNDGKLDFVNKGIREGAYDFFDKYYENRRNLIFLNYKKILSKNYVNPSNSEFEKEYKLLFFLENIIENLKFNQMSYAIFIPSKFEFFWNISCDTQLAPLIVPGIANLAIIDGLPEYEQQSCYGHKHSYGFNRYYMLQDQNNHTRIYQSKDKEKICEYSINKKFDNIIMIDIKDNEFIHEILECKISN